MPRYINTFDARMGTPEPLTVCRATNPNRTRDRPLEPPNPGCRAARLADRLSVNVATRPSQTVSKNAFEDAASLELPIRGSDMPEL